MTLPCGDRAADDHVDVEYLGAGGLRIAYRDEVLMTAPFFSNPGLLGVGLGFDVHREAGRRGVESLNVDGVKAIVGAQAHYDHLADLPLLVPRLPTETKIWTNRTGVALLEAAGVERGRLEAMNEFAGDVDAPGRWIMVGRYFRFMPLESEHAPHFLGVKLFSGELEAPPKHAPRSAWDWLEGRTYALLIDVLAGDGSGRPLMRLHYQDAASNPPLGFPPNLHDGKAVDVAILCVASFEQVADYPEGILRHTRAPIALLTHWESFFRRQGNRIHAVPFTDTEAFVERLERALPVGGRWLTPQPRAMVRIPLCDA